ncbi:hypothetical protein [Streptomyces milbemycinicus]|uniref:Uncharacterized protein n=1 Tax=Streptomyces milbemycinicus TaxID=476552 RepID=A0ABW8LPR2_9ACTN
MTLAYWERHRFDDLAVAAGRDELLKSADRNPDPYAAFLNLLRSGRRDAVVHGAGVLPLPGPASPVGLRQPTGRVRRGGAGPRPVGAARDAAAGSTRAAESDQAADIAVRLTDLPELELQLAGALVLTAHLDTHRPLLERLVATWPSNTPQADDIRDALEEDDGA